MLLERAPGADVNVTSKEANGVTALWQACQNGHGEVVRLLLASSGIDVNQARTDNGSTPLFQACYDGNTPVAELLLISSDIDLNKVPQGWSLLRAARENNHTEIVQLLIDAGAQ